MSNLGNIADCYFYYYSSCTKGVDCPFRHCKAALGTEIVCSLWREGRCFRENCKFRHMENRINRATIQCYWEDQPSGCLKPHCVFRHRKPRMNIHTNSGNEGLILPLSTTTTPINHTAKVSDAKDLVKNTVFSPVVENYSNHIDSPNLSPTSHPVEPIVVSLNGEESDSESACSTPMKSASDSKYSSSPVKRNLMDNFTDIKEDDLNDLGIKTLEQIKMEKIYKESEHFYKPVDAVIPDENVGVVRNATFLCDNFSLSAYDSPVPDPALLKMKSSLSYKTELSPESDFKLVSDIADEPMCCSNGTSVQTPENEGVHKRWTLKRRLSQTFTEQTMLPCKKKIVCLKRSSKKEDPLDFKVKTLAEIRQEKKLVNEEMSCEQNRREDSSTDDNLKSLPTSLSNTSESSNLNGKSFRRLKIKRQTNESLFSSAILSEANHSDENGERGNRTQMILHEVQNISDEQNKSEAKGKRRENETTCSSRNLKLLTLESSSLNSSNNLPHSSSDLLNNPVREKPIKKVNHPVIKRSQLSSNVSPPHSTKPSSVTEAGIKEQLVSPSNKELKTRSSVDEIDSFLLNDGELPLDYEPDSVINEPEDLLLELEQLLES